MLLLAFSILRGSVPASGRSSGSGVKHAFSPSQSVDQWRYEKALYPYSGGTARDFHPSSLLCPQWAPETILYPVVF